ncbi:uncharacterized protein LOC119375418 [Rhipicephalus sanguineus]|uniref:uncharacterized protein LOC119375418 n=1 Tax=Rhipicephalus sanguineus TaxID=34632 RepID=UPI0020C4A151|nr:uncharacterized protein LOC119375418 [Rhipicephalus sanguineus]
MGLEGDELKAWLDEREARAREDGAAEREERKERMEQAELERKLEAECQKTIQLRLQLAQVEGARGSAASDHGRQGKMSKDDGKNRDRRRRHHKKSADGGATSGPLASPSGHAPMSCVASPSSEAQSPVVRSPAQPAWPRAVTNAQQTPPSAPGVSPEEEPPPGSDSGGLPFRGSAISATVTPATSGAIAEAAAPKPDGHVEQRILQQTSEGGTATQAVPAATGSSASTAVNAATFSGVSQVHAEPPATTKGRDEGVTTALTGLVSSGKSEHVEPSKGRALQRATTATMGRTITDHELGAAGRLAQNGAKTYIARVGMNFCGSILVEVSKDWWCLQTLP